MRLMSAASNEHVNMLDIRYAKVPPNKICDSVTPFARIRTLAPTEQCNSCISDCQHLFRFETVGGIMS